MAGQDNVSAQKAFLEDNGCNLQRRQLFPLRCHDFESNRLVGVVVKYIGAGGFGLDFWAGTGR